MNIRGLGGRIKRKYISDLIKKQQVGFICLQETKCGHNSKERCYQIWGEMKSSGLRLEQLIMVER